MRTGTVLGGMPYPKQRKLLDQPLDILVATPGRLIDFMEQGKVDFSRLELLVLDEADRMLDMGFIKPVEIIAAATPATRQTLLFSATLDGGIATARANACCKNPQADRSAQRPRRATKTSSSACITSMTAATSTGCSTTCCAMSS